MKNSVQGSRFRVQWLIILLIIAASAAVCYAQPVSSAELINNGKFYDGKIVAYEGEVIGDIMERGEFAWLNVHDGEKAIGVWAQKSLAEVITRTGSYRAKGDWIEVNGVFHLSCPEHAGDTDIHAQKIKIIDRGKAVEHKLNIGKRNLASVFFGALILIWILTLLKRR